MRDIKIKINDDGYISSYEKFIGIQNENEATRLVFILPDVYVKDGCYQYVAFTLPDGTVKVRSMTNHECVIDSEITSQRGVLLFTVVVKSVPNVLDIETGFIMSSQPISGYIKKTILDETGTNSIDKNVRIYLDEFDSLLMEIRQSSGNIKNLTNGYASTINNLLVKYNNKIDSLYNELNEKIANITNNATDMVEVIDARCGFETLGLRLKSKPYYFDNVASMKSSKLKSGDCAITLGYYEENDGGGATYKIRSKGDSDVEDNGSIHFIGSNIIAELILDNNINAKTFGAKGDGITDDTNAIKMMYSCASIETTNNYFNVSIFPKFIQGKYLVSDTIEIPVYIKTKISGNVTIISNINNKALIRIKSDNNIKDTSVAIQTQAFVDGDIFSTIGGVLILQRVNNIEDINTDNTSIGISIDADVSKSINISRCNFNNIVIIGFNIALNINMVNTYLLTFKNCRFEWNKYNVYFDGTKFLNSGENISFNNCIFSHAYNSIFLNSQISALNFNECSFDFNGNHILINKASNGLINCVNCHFEGVGFTSNTVTCNNTVGFGYIVYRNIDNKYTCTNVSIDNCFLHLNTYNPANHLFGCANSSNGYNKSLRIKLNMCGLSYSENKLNFDNRYLADENTEITGNSFNNTGAIIPYQYSSDDYYGKFKGISNDYICNYKTDKSILNNNQIFLATNDYSSGNVNISLDVSDKIFEKSLVVNQESSSTYCIFTRRIYPKGKKIQVTSYVKDGGIITNSDYTMNLNYKYLCKDNNNVTLTTRQDTFIPNSNQQYIKDGWLCSTIEFIIPVNCKFVNISASVTFKDSNNNSLSFTGTVKCGGIIINELY